MIFFKNLISLFCIVPRHFDQNPNDCINIYIRGNQETTSVLFETQCETFHFAVFGLEYLNKNVL